MRMLIIFLFLTFTFSNNAFPNVYYVSNTGSDGNDGLSKDSPLKTLTVAAGKVTPGDMILLRRGDVFRESVRIETINIELNAFGSAEEPLPVISDFKLYKDNIYVAGTDAIPGYLFANGKLMTIARYPNKGWLRTKYWEDTKVPRRATPEQLSKPNTVVTCPELADYPRNSEDYWVGANIRWRHHSWWFETRTVIDYDPAGRLSLEDRSFSITRPREQAEKGWGFYLDGKLDLLDTPGEWFYDADRKLIYLYPPGGQDPNSLLIECSSLSTGLSVKDAAVKNIRFCYQKDIGLQVDGISVVQQCEFEGIGRDAKVSEHGAGGAALRAEQGVRKARISHNTFRNNFNLGISWWQNPGDTTSSVIERNLVQNTGIVPGYGGSGSWHAVAILIGRGRGVHVQHNRVESSGYVGILFGSEGNFAEYNIIKNAMATLNDGGGIYTNCSRTTIRYNIILDTKGGMESSGSWANISHGIWPEFLREYRESIIEYNTIAGSGSDGIFLPNNFDCIVRNNVCYNNERYQLLFIGNEGRKQINVKQNNLITGNVLYAAKPTQNTLYFDARNDYGTLKDNYYCKPFSAELIHEGKNWPGMGRHELYTLTQWQNKFSWADKSPKTDIRKVTSGEENDNSQIFINETEETKTFPLNGKWHNLDGETVTGSITLEPYTSRILIRM